MNATRQIVERSLEAQFIDLPQSSIDAAKKFILDTIGVGIAGAKAAYADDIVRAAQAWGGPAIAGSAHLMGRRQRLPAPSAAFVNGFQIHCQEFDCVHEGAVVHPMATIFAALQAEAEAHHNLAGQDFILAVIIAVDLAVGIGVSSNAAIKFFRPANAGLFGATLGIARLRGFSVEQTLSALGFALAHCSGTMQSHIEGKPALPIQIANAARAAIMACDLAANNIPGPEDVLEGQFGYFPLFEGDWDIDRLLGQSLGQRITEVSHKPFPTGRAAQGGIVAMQKLRARGVTPENVVRIELKVPPLIERLVGRAYQDGMDVNYARLCFAYSGAVTLFNGTIGLDDFESTALESAETAILAQKIKITLDGSTDPSTFTPQVATAKLSSGEEISVEINQLFGSPNDPLSDEQHLKKFDACIDFSGLPTTAGVRLKDAIENLTTIKAAGLIARLTSGYLE